MPLDECNCTPNESVCVYTVHINKKKHKSNWSISILLCYFYLFPSLKSVFVDFLSLVVCVCVYFEVRNRNGLFNLVSVVVTVKMWEKKMFEHRAKVVYVQHSMWMSVYVSLVPLFRFVSMYEIKKKADAMASHLSVTEECDVNDRWRQKIAPKQTVSRQFFSLCLSFFVAVCLWFRPISSWGNHSIEL